LRALCSFPWTAQRLGSMCFFHLSQHCFFVRPRTSAVIETQFLPPCVCTAANSLTSSSPFHLPVHPFTRSMLGSKVFMPSASTLHSRLTRNQRSNCGPLLATVLYCILQLDIFVLFPFPRTSSHPVDTGIQGITPSIPTLNFRSTRNQRGKAQFLSPCVCTAALSLMSYSSFHLSVYPIVRSVLGSKALSHLFRHCSFVRFGTSLAIATQFLLCFFLRVFVTAVVSFASSTSVQRPVAPVVLAFAGFLLRTKFSNVDEGGVNSGLRRCRVRIFAKRNILTIIMNGPQPKTKGCMLV
jgi:hypothetical protein